MKESPERIRVKQLMKYGVAIEIPHWVGGGVGEYPIIIYTLTPPSPTQMSFFFAKSKKKYKPHNRPRKTFKNKRPPPPRYIHVEKMGEQPGRRPQVKKEFPGIRWKKMNCSPFAQNQSVDGSTCYTDKILFEIRDAFNAQPQNAHSPITSNTPKIVLYQLRKRMSNSCEKEKCWLELLSPEQRRVVDETVFAPEKPAEWKKNPHEWLSNYDILKVLRQYEKSNPTFKFIEPTPIDFDTVLSVNGESKCVTDDLCNFSLKHYIEGNYKQIGIIFNLDKHTQKGSHWVSLFIDIEHSFIFYFDSATNKTPREIRSFVEKVQTQSLEVGNGVKYTYYENYPNNHQRSTTECGMYSLFFIITMLDKSRTIKSKIRLFKEKKVTDKQMRRLRDVYFND